MLKKVQTKHTIDEFKSLFKAQGAEVISDTYINGTTPLKFLCAKCGKETSITPKHFLEGRNPKCLCKECKNPSFTTEKMLKNFLEEKGSELIEVSHLSDNAEIKCLCTVCKQPFKTKFVYLKTRNKNVRCPNCSLSRRKDFNTIKEFFESKGVVLLTTDYINENQHLRFLCTKCGKEYYTTWKNIKANKNKDFLCDTCNLGKVHRPNGNYGLKRELKDQDWLHTINDFFNCKGYASHHIKKWQIFEELRTSITNGFPLKKEIHENEYAFLHNREEGFEIHNWNKAWRAPWQYYEGFNYLDLSSELITETIAPVEDLEQNELLNKKRLYFNEGILYIPIYFEELYISGKDQIIFSMIRNRLWKKFPQIYKYTNQEHTIYYARNLEFKEISNQAAKTFFNFNHIQGFISGEYYFGLFKDKELVAAMIFAKSRFNKNFEYELLRYAIKINTSIVGGAQKLFKHFLKLLKPKSIISYCDLRFSSLDPEQTVYPKLGFEYLYTTKPSYKYLDPEVNRLFNRMQFQKHKLSKMLNDYDERLSESENMRENGYIKVYDCGNFVFGWREKA